jgi:hypothetical protein
MGKDRASRGAFTWNLSENLVKNSYSEQGQTQKRIDILSDYLPLIRLNNILPTKLRRHDRRLNGGTHLDNNNKV